MGTLLNRSGYYIPQARAILANNDTVDILDLAGHDFQEIVGYVKITASPQYTASYRLNITVSEDGIYEISYLESSGDDNQSSPIVSFSMSGSILQATLSNYSGFTEGYFEYRLLNTVQTDGLPFPLPIEAFDLTGEVQVLTNGPQTYLGDKIFGNAIDGFSLLTPSAGGETALSPSGVKNYYMTANTSAYRLNVPALSNIEAGQKFSIKNNTSSAGVTDKTAAVDFAFSGDDARIFAAEPEQQTEIIALKDNPQIPNDFHVIKKKRKENSPYVWSVSNSASGYNPLTYLDQSSIAYSPELGKFVSIYPFGPDYPSFVSNGRGEWEYTRDVGDSQRTLSDITWAPGAINGTGVFIFGSWQFGIWSTGISADGVNWTFSSPNYTSFDFENIAWSRDLGRFVAISSTGTMYSSDGINWTKVGLGIGNWISMQRSDEAGLFITADYNSGYIATSADGITWDTINAGQTGFQDIAWSKELGFFIISGINKMHKYVPGDSAITSYSTSTCSWRNILWIPELRQFYAVGTSNLSSRDRIAVSPDGIFWSVNEIDSSLSSLIGAQIKTIAWSNRTNEMVNGKLFSGKIS